MIVLTSDNCLDVISIHGYSMKFRPVNDIIIKNKLYYGTEQILHQKLKIIGIKSN